MISFINSLHAEIKETSDCGFDTITLYVKQFLHVHLMFLFFWSPKGNKIQRVETTHKKKHDLGPRDWCSGKSRRKRTSSRLLEGQTVEKLEVETWWFHMTSKNKSGLPKDVSPKCQFLIFFRIFVKCFISKKYHILEFILIVVTQDSHQDNSQ